jgi:two-component system KDP operon response regulator KdpE
MTTTPNQAGAESTVVIVEDEPEIRRFLRTSLAQHGYRVVESETGRDGLTQAHARNPDVILVDLGLPDMDGVAVVKELRTWTTVPIIIVSARDQEATKVAALDAGADDYVTKPFGVDELLARIRASLRHMARVAVNPGEAAFVTGTLRVDFEHHRVFVADREVHLTPIEFKLLATLARHAGKVLTHRQLLKEVWGPLHVEEDHYVRVYMRQLRQKIEVDPARPKYLLTELGVGYRLFLED